jgi:peptidoglycan/LPS O-acetylase OafA/YrhL
MSAPPTLMSDLAQLTMLPLNFTERFPDMLLPQGWSLGLELMFYAVFPFILIPRARLMAAYASALVFLFAYCGKLNPDWFAYRLLPGVLFVFMLGSWIRTPESKLGRWPIAFAFVIAVAALYMALKTCPRRVSVCDTLIGLVVGLPIVCWLARTHLGGRWEKLAGDLSYGVFLNHMLLLPIVVRFLPDVTPSLRFALLIPVSVALSYVTFRWIETPAIALRRTLRLTPAAARAPVAKPEIGGGRVFPILEQSPEAAR